MVVRGESRSGRLSILVVRSDRDAYDGVTQLSSRAITQRSDRQHIYRLLEVDDELLHWLAVATSDLRQTHDDCLDFGMIVRVDGAMKKLLAFGHG